MKKSINKLTPYVLLISLISCNKKESFELEILNDTIYSYSNSSKKDTISMIKYKLKNNTSNIYYFNPNFNRYKKIELITSDGILIADVYDCNHKKFSNNGYIIYDRTEEFLNYDKVKSLKVNNWLKILNKNDERILNNNDFFIRPNETIYFGTYVKINAKGSLNYENVIHSCNIKKDIKYLVEFKISCDTFNLYKNLLWHQKQNIKQKKAVVFQGIIKSRKVPLKVIE